MFGGILAALNSLMAPRKALNYENYIHTGQGFPSNKIYCESSVDRRARKELAAVRYRERLQQQVKFARLMKKLLIEADQEVSNGDIDDELEQMRDKFAQLQLKVEQAAHKNDINCKDMLDMHKPDDAYDIELEQIIRNAALSVASTDNVYSKTIEQTSNLINEKLKQTDKACGDNVYIQTLNTNEENLFDNED